MSTRRETAPITGAILRLPGLTARVKADRNHLLCGSGAWFFTFFFYPLPR